MNDLRHHTGPGPAADPFGGAFTGRRVLLTGQTGFKGGWLAMWLDRLGAETRAVALPPDTQPALYHLARSDTLCDSRFADINTPRDLARAVAGFRPDLIIHMAAQAIVRDGYDRPAETFATNVVGTANVLEIARAARDGLSGVIVVTSDKCYDNREWDWGYRETDRLGGRDPYSASKACTELVAEAYRQSFFADPAGPQLATVRAGNVIGGGDWSSFRLIPDIVRATLEGRETVIRNPASLRPWQHVLEPLAGYLSIGAAMLDGRGTEVAGAWNFGPDNDAAVPVGTLCAMLAEAWGEGGPRFRVEPPPNAPHEAGILRLDSTKARQRLGWQPRLSLREALAMTAAWYRAQAAGADMLRLSLTQIAEYAARLRPAVLPFSVSAPQASQFSVSRG